MDEGNQRSLAFLTAIVASAQDAIISSDAREVITTWNPAAERLFGYTAAEAIGQPYALIMPPGNETERREFLTNVLERGFSQRVETTRRRKDGGLIAVETIVTTVHEPSGRLLGYASITRDISARKAAEAERLATHQTVREVLGRITDGFFALDRAWRFTYVNETAERILGRSRSDLLGANVWHEFVPAVSTAAFTALQQAMVEGRTTSFEFYYPPLQAWFAGWAYPSAGGLSVFFHDVTGQKHAEGAVTELVAQLSATNRELEQVSAAKSEFVSTISHEFRTPLTSIQGFSELLEGEDLTGEEIREFARTINQNALRLARMVSDVLDLDRLEAGVTEVCLGPTDLNAVVRAVLASLEPTAPRHQLVAHLGPALPRIQGDADLLARVLTNLVANAVKYAPAGGPVTVTTSRRHGDVELTVADEGLGVPTEHRERIFSRHGRIARPEQEGIDGTGLGLPIARHILELHNGRIWVEPNTPVGSIFHVVLPTAAPMASP
jgi:PAS domain S-box-containing protein